MAVELSEIIAFLKRGYLFQGLTDEQLAWVAAQFMPKTLEKDTIVFSQGSPGDAFFIVFQGKVRATRLVREQERFLNYFIQGDFFGEEALIFNRPRSATLTTVEKTTLLRMEREQFIQMLIAYPKIRENINATAESRHLARSRHFPWLRDDEVIYFICRKHEFFLFVQLLLPILLGVGSIPVLAIGLAGAATPFTFTFIEVIGVLMLVGALILGVWLYADWENDYYIVTSQRVVWVEKVVGIYDSRQEAPLDTVLAVDVSSSQIGRWLDYGNVSVRTFTGGIYMRRAHHPYRFASFVEGFKKRAVEMSKEQEKRAIDEAVERALAQQEEEVVPSPVVIPEAPPPPPPPEKKKKKKRMSFRQWLDNLLKVRYEQDGVITYRKHWFVLVSKAGVPFVLTIGMLAFMGYATVAGIRDQLPFSLLALCSLGFLIFIGVFGWLVYQYLDWSNDIYRLTPDQILDIERKPLGREVRKTAPLENILSIEHERGNILGILLNFGTVTINVGETRFIFYTVFNPGQVHQDIFDFREALLRRKRAQEQARERERMVDWLVSYYHQAEKLEELENKPDTDEF